MTPSPRRGREIGAPDDPGLTGAPGQTGAPGEIGAPMTLVSRALRGVADDDRGSTIPLILGFFLIGLLMVAGAVMASDAFTKQRDLQSVCDGAALAGANAIDGPAARTRELTAALPLAEVQAAVQHYLAADPGRAEVSVQAALSADGSTVLADCRTRTQLAFARLIGRGDGIDQHARAQARGLVQ